MIDRSEREIMENWSQSENPVVSVCCTTYNHESYISDAIDGFLKQETDFPFEIIIRDDCSTDRTAEIIRRYVSKYPSIIKTIYEEENQYSKGVKPMFAVFKKAKGEYLALCEGDDYWTDTEKLQVQVKNMIDNPGVDLSFHCSTELRDNIIVGPTAEHSGASKIFTTSEVILGDGAFCPTASLMVKRYVISGIPSWFYAISPTGDYFLQIYGSLRGGALYINRNMSVYRLGAPTSWTSTTQDLEKRLIFTKQFEQALSCFRNDYSVYRYETKTVISRHCMRFLTDSSLSKEVKESVYVRYKENLSSNQRIYWLLICRNPMIYKAFADIRKKVRYYEFRSWTKKMLKKATLIS